jgi:hypothetical protein
VSTAQYANRTIDVLAWNADNLDGSMVGTESGGKVVAGILALAQRFMITLLQELRSVRYNPTEGTDFMTRIRLGNMMTEDELISMFVLSELQARAQLVAEDKPASDPSDECYDHSDVTSVTIGETSVTLRFKLYSKATSVEVVLPISTLP